MKTPTNEILAAHIATYTVAHAHSCHLIELLAEGTVLDAREIRQLKHHIESVVHRSPTACTLIAGMLPG